MPAGNAAGELKAEEPRAWANFENVMVRLKAQSIDQRARRQKHPAKRVVEQPRKSMRKWFEHCEPGYPAADDLRSGAAQMLPKVDAEPH